MKDTTPCDAPSPRRETAVDSLAMLALGGVLTLMNGLNSAFASVAGNRLATLVAHMAGLATVSLVLLVRPEPRAATRPPLHLYGAGFIGVFLVLSSNLCFQTLGASLCVSVFLLAQIAGSILTDATGLLGMRRRGFEPRRLGALAVVLGGIAIMTEVGRPPPAYVLLALATGFLPLLSSILNARLGEALGPFRGARVNFLVGLGTILAVIALTGSPLAGSFALLREVPLPVMLGGGMLSVLVVGGLNRVFPRLPTLRSTLLLFLGQLLVGLAADALVTGAPPARKLLGAGLVLAGLFLDSALESGADARRTRTALLAHVPAQAGQPPGSKTLPS